MFSDAVLRSRQSDISEAVNGRVYPTQGLELENLGEEDDNADEDIEEVTWQAVSYTFYLYYICYSCRLTLSHKANWI